MKTQFFNDIEDIGWILTTHLKNIPHVFNSFMLYGNEDCPEKVELFKRQNPTVNSKPFATFVMDDNGNLVEKN